MNITTVEDTYLRRNGVPIQTEGIHLLAANALQYVIKNAFAKQTNTFVLTMSTNNKAVELWFNDVIRRLFSIFGFITLQLIVLHSKSNNVEPSSHLCCHMVLIDSFKSLERTNIARFNQNSHSLEYYLIFLQTYDELRNQEMELIFRYCYDNYWLHCNVMVQSRNEEILMYSYFPFKENNCFRTQPEVINQFKDNRFVDRKIFPYKLDNMQGCPLIISTWDTPPFVKNGTNEKYPGLKATGFEMIVLSEIGKTMNFSMDLDWIAFNKTQSPEAKFLEKLKYHETNVTLGVFRVTTERNAVATPTIVTYNVPIIPFVLRKLSTHKSIGLLTFPFDHSTWLLLIVVYSAIGILNVFESKNIKTGVFQTFEIVIGSAVKTVPKKSSSRLRFIITIVTSFVLRSVYQSLLFYIFRTNFYLTPPYSLKGLGEEGYKALATDVTAKFLLQIPELANNTLPLIITNSSSELSPFRYMEFHREELLVTMSIVEFGLRYVQAELAFGSALRLLPLKVTDQQIVFYLPKHSYLIDRFNDYILRLNAAGLLEMWKKWTNADFKVLRRTVSRNEYNSAMIINLKQFSGFLTLMAILHMTSIVFFILEMLSIKFKKLQKFF